MKSVALLAAVLLMPWSGLAAQAESSGLVSGTRARVHAPAAGQRRVTAQIAFVDRDSIVLERGRGAERIVIPARAVERLEISRGKDHWAGAMRGSRVGALAVGLYVAAEYAVSDGVRDERTMAAFIAGMIVGAPIGAVIGGALGVERWESRLMWPQMGLGPDLTGRLGLGGSWKLPYRAAREGR